MGFFIDPLACQQAARIALVFLVMRTGSSSLSLFLLFPPWLVRKGWVVDPIGYLTTASWIFDLFRSRRSSGVFSCDPGRRGDGLQFPRARSRRACVAMRPTYPKVGRRPPLFFLFLRFFFFFVFFGGVVSPSVTPLVSGNPGPGCATPTPAPAPTRVWWRRRQAAKGKCWSHLGRKGPPWDGNCLEKEGHEPEQWEDPRGKMPRCTRLSPPDPVGNTARCTPIPRHTLDRLSHPSGEGEKPRENLLEGRGCTPAAIHPLGYMNTEWTNERESNRNIGPTCVGCRGGSSNPPAPHVRRVTNGRLGVCVWGEKHRWVRIFEKRNIS